MSATTVFGSPVLGSPVLGSPVLGSPVLGSRFPSGAGRSVVLRRRAVAAAVALLLAAALVVAVGALLPRLAQADTGSAVSVTDAAVVQQGPALQEHRVVPGDTLWGLAVEASGGGDPREAVDRIMRVNSMQTPALQVGETVLLPAES